MHAITIINGQSMRFEVFDPVPTGTELTTTEGDHVLFEGIDDAGLLLCSRKVDGQISAYFPHDLLLPANPEAENRRACVAAAADAVGVLQEAEEAIHRTFFVGGAPQDVGFAAHHVARVELACQRLRAAIGNDLVSAARVGLLAMQNQIKETSHAQG